MTDEIDPLIDPIGHLRDQAEKLDPSRRELKKTQETIAENIKRRVLLGGAGGIALTIAGTDQFSQNWLIVGILALFGLSVGLIFWLEYTSWYGSVLEEERCTEEIIETLWTAQQAEWESRPITQKRLEYLKNKSNPPDDDELTYGRFWLFDKFFHEEINSFHIKGKLLSSSMIALLLGYLGLLASAGLN